MVQENEPTSKGFQLQFGAAVCLTNTTGHENSHIIKREICSYKLEMFERENPTAVFPESNATFPNL